MAKQMSNNMVSVAGEYFVCAELGRKGYLALLTPKNNPLFDIVVSNADGSKTVSIQVKTRSVGNKAGWKLARDLERKLGNPHLYVALVQLSDTGMPDIWLYEYDVLAERVAAQFAKYISKKKRDGHPRKDPGFRWHDLRHFTAEDRLRKNAWPIITDRLQ